MKKIKKRTKKQILEIRRRRIRLSKKEGGGGESNLGVIVVKFSELDAWLKSQPENTPETAYKLNITELTKNDIKSSMESGSLGYALWNNKTKYVDLTSTTLPNDIEMDNAFRGCLSLVKAPLIPDNVTDMSFTFTNCLSLVEAPIIPNSVTHMTYAFAGCKSLVKVPVISSSVTDITCAFDSCISLESVTIKEPLRKLDHINDCFKNTPSTLKIYVPKEMFDELTENNFYAPWGLTSIDVFVEI